MTMLKQKKQRNVDGYIKTRGFRVSKTLAFIHLKIIKHNILMIFTIFS